MALTAMYLVTGTYNQNIHVYDRRTLEHQHTLVGHLGIVMSLATSTSGQVR